jgi:hypothetical protein
MLALLHCPPASIGPGSLHRAGTAGATCLLAEFQAGCRPADYTLSSFGVDTVHSIVFRVDRQSGRCTVAVRESFRVVPQKPHMTLERTCSKLLRAGTDVVAVRCTGGPPATLSLTKLG